MSQVDVDRYVFKEAKKFLLKNTPESVTEEVISEYLSFPELRYDLTLNRIYKGLLSSAQNANMKSNVIGGSINGFENFSKVLHDFDHEETLKEFSGDADKLFRKIKEILKPTGKLRENSRSSWPQYCKTILSSASFLSQFKDAKEFQTWANSFYKDKNTISALPMILSEEIHGIGFPLACDFLKDLGYSKFGKPDVHIKQIFEATSLTSKNSSNYKTLNAIFRVSQSVEKEAYEVDKIFWLIGSGKFYNHKHIGNNGKIESMKKKFINHILKHPQR